MRPALTEDIPMLYRLHLARWFAGRAGADALADNALRIRWNTRRPVGSKPARHLL